MSGLPIIRDDRIHVQDAMVSIRSGIMTDTGQEQVRDCNCGKCVECEQRLDQGECSTSEAQAMANMPDDEWTHIYEATGTDTPLTAWSRIVAQNTRVSRLEQDKADLIEEGLANEATIARLREELALWKADHWSNGSKMTKEM